MEKSMDEGALDQILGDMDDMESKRVYGDQPEDAGKGVTVTIDVAPKAAAEEKKDEPALELPADEPTDDDDTSMPPFLRKLR